MVISRQQEAPELQRGEHISVVGDGDNNHGDDWLVPHAAV